MKYIFSTLALAAASLATPVPEAAAPPSFRINKIVSGGSGCPQGSIDIDYTNNQILPIYFGKDFTANVGTNVPADQSRKNCQINIDILYSPGYQVAVYSTDFSGWGDIDAGVKGWIKSTYYFSGETAQVSSTLNLPGPFNGRYNKHDDVVVTNWSPCGNEAMLNVNTEVALTPLGNGKGTLAATRESARVQSVLYIKWRQC